jgi:two-component system, chemotaxis family, protein-glutamate methylesterase/glutaminase
MQTARTIVSIVPSDGWTRRLQHGMFDWWLQRGPSSSRALATRERTAEAQLASKDIIVVGGSAGGVEALKTLVTGLPGDLQAAVLVVIHIPPTSPGRLPDILQRHANVRVAWARDEEAIECGRVYIAPPDRHLVVDDGHLRLTRAPRENHTRPAIDPLFRSAALAYGPRVIGVVLSGRLDDGTAGLWAVKERGGTTVVQDPGDAAQPDMPRNALEHTDVDYIVPCAQLGALLGRLAAECAHDTVAPVSAALALEVKIAMEANALRHGVMSLGPTTPYTCPDCHGVLVRVDQGGIPRFRCHTGHAYALDSLLSAMTDSVESTLWSALRSVEESIMLLREASVREQDVAGGIEGIDPRFEQKMHEAQARADLIREAVTRHQALSLGLVRATALAPEPEPEPVPEHEVAARG